MEEYYFEEKNFLADRLREIRMHYGFKQEDIAKMLNISRSTYSYYETASTRPDPSALAKLALYYKLPINVFFDEESLFVDDSVNIQDSGNRRASRKASVDPDKVGELMPEERSLILTLRAYGIDVKALKESIEAEHKAD